MISPQWRSSPDFLPGSPNAADAIRDPERLAALERSGLLDTLPEPAFDRLTRLATTILGVPVAAISLVAADRQFFKSCIGLPEPWASRRETPLTHSFCQRAVIAREPLVIVDAREDPLATDSLAVADLGVIAYAGIPLITSEGYVLGAFCAIDGEPRIWSERDLAILADLAAAVVTEIELRAAIATAQEREAALRDQERLTQAMLDAAPTSLYVFDLVERRTVFASPRGLGWLGLTAMQAEAFGADFLSQVMHPDDLPGVEAHFRQCVTAADGQVLEFEYRMRDDTGAWRWFHSRDVVFARGSHGEARQILGLALDITERKEAEARLRDTEEQFRATVEQAAVGIAHVAPDGRWLLVNQWLCEIVGYTREELQSLTFQEITHPDDLDADLDSVRRVLAGEIDSYRMNKRYLRKDGSVVWADLTVSLVRGPMGTPRYFISVIEDITTRIAAESALRVQEARSRFLADLRERLDAIADPESLFDIAANALGAFLGVTVVNVHEIDVAADAVRRHTAHRDGRFGPEAQALSAAYAPEMRARLAAGRTVAITDVRGDPLTAGRADIFEQRGTRALLAAPLLRDGIWVGALILGHDQPREWPDDEIALVRTVAERVWLAYENARLLRDLRAGEERSRRQAETIRRQLAEIELIYDNAPVGLAVLDRELRFVRVNERLAEINGVPEAGHLGRKISEVAPHLAGAAEPLLHQILETGEPLLDVEIAGEAAAQPGVERIWLEHWYPVRDDDGRVAGINVVVQEITERKRAEADRVAFLDAVAHDVKNPLGAAKGQAQLLRRRLRRGVDDLLALETSLDAIEEGVNTATALIEELLDAAHLRAGRALELRLTPVDLAAMAETAVAQTRRTITRHEVQLIATEPSLIVEGDEARLRRVVGNLLGNAVKYSPEGGTVVVRIGREEDAAGTWAVIAVSDEGIGIPAADLPYVFERFHRGGNVAGIGGTGIGLAGSKQIVEQHGGTIAAESVEGQGSTFTVRLPLP